MTSILPEGTPDQLTTFQVARLLGLAVRSIQLMVDRQELEAWKTQGGHRRISRASVERWLRAHPRHHKGEVGLAALSASGLAAAPATGRGMAAERWSAPVLLLIEDSVHYQNLVRMLVEEYFPAARLQIASDGISGLAMFGSVQPDVLMVDMMLPGIDGATLISALRTHPAFRGTQLVVVTSLSPEEIKRYAFVLQGVTVIHKVDLVERLPQELRRVLSEEAALAGAT